MGHYEHWREDLALARALGVRAIRWGIPWYRVEPRPGEFDWGWTDQVLPYIAEELGISVILDLMHYGTPLWLERSFAARDYPQRVAAYARAVAERYRGLIHSYTPLNEPVVNAMQCGRFGQWPPYLSGEPGYVRVLLQLVRGMQNCARAIRAADPDAVLVAVEAMGWCRPGVPAVAPRTRSARARDRRRPGAPRRSSGCRHVTRSQASGFRQATRRP